VLKKKSTTKGRLFESRGGYAFEAGHENGLEVPPSLDFTADSDVVRVVVEGERLTYGHLFNPAFATEISLIEPLPHQRIAVYDHMLQQSRLRFLLAEDVPVDLLTDDATIQSPPPLTSKDVIPEA
jgi:hypothetical protein